MSYVFRSYVFRNALTCISESLTNKQLDDIEEYVNENYVSKAIVREKLERLKEEIDYTTKES